MRIFEQVSRVALMCATVGCLLGGTAFAAETVKIGLIEPMSGNAASVGASAKAGIEVAMDIINNAHSDLGDILLARDAGLKNLGGAKVQVVFADNQGSPSVGQNQALRLITQEHVTALVGAYQSGITLTASAVAERYGVPFVNGASVASNLTERGYKWFFRTTPIATDIANVYMSFLKDMKSQGKKVDNLAIVYENTDYGTSISNVLSAAAKRDGFNVISNLAYSANTSDVSSTVLQLKNAKPDAVIFVSYTSDAILYAKTMKSLDYKPSILIGDDSGFSDPTFIKTVGADVQGVLNRSVWSTGKPGSATYLINEMYKKKTGAELDTSTARIMQAFFVLVDAINRAGSTEPAKIQAALKATDIKPPQLIVGFKGVKFNDQGQNVLASAVMIQLHGDRYVEVWPKEKATAELQLPYKGW